MASRKASVAYKDSVLAALRIVMGWTMLWAFLDKVFGLGFSTKPESSWLSGISPTSGFLKFGTKGPFAETFQGLIGQPWVDWLFMIGLVGIGVAFILGIAMRFAGYFGALMMILMYLAAIQPEHNPITDDHIINALVFLYLGHSNIGETWGFQRSWRESIIVKSLPFLA